MESLSITRSIEDRNIEVNTATSVSTGTTIRRCFEDPFLEYYEKLELPWMVSLGHGPTRRCILDSRIQLEVQWSMGNWALVLHPLIRGYCKPINHGPQNIDPCFHVGVCSFDSRKIVASPPDAWSSPWCIHHIQDGLEYDQANPSTLAR